MRTHEQQVEYMRQWHKTHKEHEKRYALQTREKRLARRRQRYKETGKEKEYLRNVRRLHPELHRFYHQRYMQKNRKMLAEKQRIYTQENREKTRAYKISAKLPLLDHCELCPPNEMRTENLHHHHPDYAEPEIYVTTCPSCHAYLHMESD